VSLVGYARVSTGDQSLDIQLSKLRLAGCNKMFSEQVSGLSSSQPALKRCLEYVREGDTLVISRLDRLARSTLHLCQIAAELERKGVALNVLDQNINTADATGRLTFNVLAAIAQFETELRAERQREGIAKAKDRGVRFGRRSLLDPNQIVELRRRRQNGETIKNLCHDFRLSSATIYRYLEDKPDETTA